MATNSTFIGHDAEEQPEISSLTAFEAYKVLAISSYADTQYKIYGPHYSGLKSLPTDTAVCGAGEHLGREGNMTQTDKKHSMESCSCGYYGYVDVNKAKRHYNEVSDDYRAGFALATVKMSGEVIVAVKGYRGQVQRVVTLDYNGCFKCEKMPEVFVSHDNGYYAPVCRSCIDAFESKNAGRRWLRRRKRETLEIITREEMEQHMTTEGYRPVSIVFHPFNSYELDL